MSKITIVPVTGAQNLSAINDNFQTIASVIENNVLFRNNPPGENNAVITDIDMNGKRIYNLPSPTSPSEPVRYQDIGDVSALTDRAQEYADAAQASAEAAALESAVASVSATNSLAHANASEASSLASAASAVDSEASAVRSEAAAAGAENRVPKTSDTGAAVIPAGSVTDRPSPIPVDGLLIRGNTDNTGKPEWYDRSTSTWLTFGTDATLAAQIAAVDSEFETRVSALEAVKPVAPGSAPIYACRAWVNFNGTGTVAIRASGNVSSITDHGTGDYTVNLTTALPDTNFAVSGTSSVGTLGTPETRCGVVAVLRVATNSVRILTAQNSDNGANPVYRDYPMNSIAIFR